MVYASPSMLHVCDAEGIQMTKTFQTILTKNCMGNGKNLDHTPEAEDEVDTGYNFTHSLTP